jgi:nitrilase
MTQIAIVQTAPIFMNKTRSIQLAVNKIAEAAKKGAELVVFSETFLPGYPAWIWRLRPGGDWGLCEQLHERLLDNSISMESDDLNTLYQAARQHKVTIVCGINERESQLGRATIYNSVITISDDGQLLNKHRKLMPTNPERMIWGFGDASGLNVVDSSAGRIGSLICWENYMPLARYALYAQGVEIYIAPTYDSGDEWISSLQHIAREGCCWVVGCGNCMQVKDIPQDFPQRDILYPDADEWINPGDSVVIAPGGKIEAGPLRKQDGILYYTIDLKKVGIAKRAMDVTGHYSRPDIFTLQVNKKSQSPVEFN